MQMTQSTSEEIYDYDTEIISNTIVTMSKWTKNYSTIFFEDGLLLDTTGRRTSFPIGTLKTK